MSRSLAMVALLLASSLIGDRVSAAPLGVRAGVVIEGSPRFNDGTWSLDFTLVTDSGDPLPLVALSVALPGATALTAVTDAQGRAQVPVSAATIAKGSVPWTVRFLGSAMHAAGEFTGVADLSRVPVGLRVTTSAGPFGLGLLPASVHVLLETLEARPKRLADTVVRIRLGDGPFQFANTGANGDLDFVLQPDLLMATSPAPGPLAVEVIFDGDAAFGSARKTATIARRVLSRVTLRVAREGDAGSGRLRFSGRASHEFGAYADALVRLSVTDEAGVPRLDLPALAGPDGIWNASVSLDSLRALGVSRVAVRAQLAPQGEIAPAQSESLRLEVPKLPGRSVVWPVLGLIGVLVAVRLLNGAARRNIIEFIKKIPAGLGAAAAALGRVLTRLLRRRAQAGGSARVGATEGIEPRSLVPGAAQPRRGVLSLSIRDKDTGGVLAATAVVTDEAGAVILHTFGTSLEFFGANDTRRFVTLSGVGLLPVTFDVTFPHDGSLDGAIVRMRRVERRLRELHEETARLHGEEPAWGLSTPREVEHRIRARGAAQGGTAQVTALVESVEMAYFAAEPPSAAEVEALEMRLRAAERAPVEAP